jgi:hypothetical protein
MVGERHLNADESHDERFAPFFAEKQPFANAYGVIDGFVSEEGCCFLRNLYEHRGNACPSMFPDETGYECFVNHIHIEGNSGTYPLPLAMVCLRSESALAGCHPCLKIP